MEKKDRDARFMRSTLETILDIRVDIKEPGSFIRDIDMIKALVKTVLAVTDE